MTLPYENATSGSAALVEAEKILRKFGCDNFGVMQDWSRCVTVVQFQWKERRIHLEASWGGYAARWLKEHPYRYRANYSRDAHEKRAKERGQLAVPSILRDWIKAQVTAIEIGVMPFDHAFMPHMLAHDGRRVADLMTETLQLEAPKP